MRTHPNADAKKKKKKNFYHIVDTIRQQIQ